MVVGPLVVPVAKLRRRSGTTARVEGNVTLDEERLAPASEADSRVPEGAEAEYRFLLESYTGGIMATGDVTVPWWGLCRRCTVAVHGVLEIALKERFCDPPARGEPEDEEAYPIVEDTVDLGPLVHEAILAELPLAPLCAEACLGLCPFCGIDRNQEQCSCVAPRDPRWASLDVLRSSS
jgi:uncharacterized protein